MAGTSSTFRATTTWDSHSIRICASRLLQQHSSGGWGACASRLVGGTLTIHQQLENRFAAFKHAQAALLFPTGYMANLAVLTTLATQGDLICIDKLTHASLIDAAQSSGATVRVYPHGDLAKLRRLLSRWHKQFTQHAPIQALSSKTDMAPRLPRALVVTDSVFSMDGDLADLPGVIALAREFGAISVVDEAHGTGVLGESGAGLCELQGVSGQVDVVISTASKALGCLGGIVTAHKLVIQTLVNHARSFIYTTGVPPMQVVAIDAALDVIRDEPQRRTRLQSMSQYLIDELIALTRKRNAGFTLMQSRSENYESRMTTPIIPLITGSAESSLALSKRLRERGFLAPAIRPPTVAPNASRVRLSLRCDLGDEDLQKLIKALADD
ncbi:MAG: 8-amino-7-oxononanoate synthase [Phycisphaerales bacterium]|nr:8-amino-7-oxononanoate synthase [Phycisphaerales bacterium]